MKARVCAIFTLLLVALAPVCMAGDSTSIAPSGVTKRSHTYTNGDNVYTSGGKVDTGGGKVETDGGHVDTQGGRVYTRGNRIYTSGGNIYTGGAHLYTSGGDIRQVDQLKANRFYAKGSGSWINYYDHIDMNGRVIYDANRVRVRDKTPNQSNELASKYYVDQQAGLNVTVRSNTCSVSYSSSCKDYCYSGEQRISGGCSATNVDSDKSSFTKNGPISNGWHCKGYLKPYSGGHLYLTAYAICAK